MPDPHLYLQAIGASFASSVIFGLLVGRVQSPMRIGTQPIVMVLAIGLGAISGFFLLRFQFVWPPANGLDRFLAFILPASLVIEILAGVPRTEPRFANFLRMALIAVSGPVLLYGSIYFKTVDSEWTRSQVAVMLVLSAALLAIVWRLMSVLSERRAGSSVPISIAVATQSAGLIVMMAGYLKGGSAAFPLAASLAGSVVASAGVGSLLRRRQLRGLDFVEGNNFQCTSHLKGSVGMGMISLYGILFIGRFFGGLTTGTAVIVLAAPLLCWLSELPGLRNKKPWQVFAIRLTLVSVPLVIVLAVASSEFNRSLAPLTR